MQDKYLFLGSEESKDHVGESTKAGIAVVLLGIMFALTAGAVVLVWSFR
jgi:hypothetical protein